MQTTLIIAGAAAVLLLLPRLVRAVQARRDPAALQTTANIRAADDFVRECRRVEQRIARLAAIPRRSRLSPPPSVQSPRRGWYE